MANEKLILRTLTSPYQYPTPDATKNSVLSWDDVDNNFIFLKGLGISGMTYVNSVLSIKQINGGEVEVPIAGGTISGASITSGDIILIDSDPHRGEVDFQSFGFNKFYTDLKQMSGQGLVNDNIGRYTLDLGSDLVTPVISSIWVVYDSNNVLITTETTQNVSVVNGSIVNLVSSSYIYTCGANEVEPTEVSGSYGTGIPGCGIESTIITDLGITTNTTKSVNLKRLSSGLLVESGKVVFPTGYDNNPDSSTVTFVNEVYHGEINGGTSSVPPTPISGDVSTGTIIMTNGNISISNVTISPDSGGNYYHHFVAYPATKGLLSTLILDGSTSVAVDGVYTKFDVTMRNSVGLNELYYVYMANDSAAYSGVDLLFQY